MRDWKHILRHTGLRVRIDEQIISAAGIDIVVRSLLEKNVVNDELERLRWDNVVRTKRNTKYKIQFVLYVQTQKYITHRRG